MLIFLKYMQTEKTSSYERNIEVLKHFQTAQRHVNFCTKWFFTVMKLIAL